MSSVFLSVLNIIAGLFNSGLIAALIKAIEDIYKASTGAEKKTIAMKMLTPITPPLGIPIISAAVDAQVSAFNEAGVFTHNPVPDPPTYFGPGPGATIDSLAP